MKQLSPVTRYNGPEHPNGATDGHADEFNKRQAELMIRDEELLKELNAGNAQTAQLTQGLNVVHSDQSSVADVLIEGRTMVNLWNHANMNYAVSTLEGSAEKEEGLFKSGWRAKRNSETTSSSHLQIRGGYRNLELTKGKYYLFGGWMKVITYDAPNQKPRISLRGVEDIGTSIRSGSAVDKLNEWSLSYGFYSPPSNRKAFLQAEILHIRDFNTGEFIVDGFFIYELTKEEYEQALLLDVYSLQEKYPYVEGVQHLQNPMLTKMGHNLLPPFFEWTHVTTRYQIEYVSPYEFRAINPNATWGQVRYEVPVISGQTYYFNFGDKTDGIFLLRYYLGNTLIETFNVRSARSFTIPNNVDRVRISAENPTISQDYIFSEPHFYIGDSPQPFQTKDDNNLFAQALLGSSVDGLVKDKILLKDGQYSLQEHIKKEVLINGINQGFFISRRGEGFTEIATKFITDYKPHSSGGKHLLINNMGKIYQHKSGSETELAETFIFGGNDLWIRLPDSETGWTSNPTNSQVATYLKENPFKLYYELSVPETHKLDVEGSIGVHEGINLISVDTGVIIRERVTPVMATGNLNINAGVTASVLKKRPAKILEVYRNGIIDTRWRKFIRSSPTSAIVTFGLAGAEIPRFNSDDLDANDVYTVTYLILDKHKFTTSLIEASLTYQTTFKSAHSRTAQQVVVNTTAITQHDLMMAEFVKTLRIMRGE